MARVSEAGKRDEEKIASPRDWTLPLVAVMENGRIRRYDLQLGGVVVPLAPTRLTIGLAKALGAAAEAIREALRTDEVPEIELDTLREYQQERAAREGQRRRERQERGAGRLSA